MQPTLLVMPGKLPKLSQAMLKQDFAFQCCEMHGTRDHGRSPHRSTEEAFQLVMNPECLLTGCCIGQPSLHCCWQGEKSKIGSSDGCRLQGDSSSGRGARIQLKGLDTEQLKGSLVVFYAPAGNSCLLRLVVYI